MPRPSTVPSLITSAAERFGSRVAIEDGVERPSFAELALAARRAAAGMLSLGVEPGDRVAIWAPNSCEWIVAALGALCAGATIVPINTRFRAGEVGYVLERSRARLLFTVDSFLGTQYVEVLSREFGGPADGRPVAGLGALDRIVLLRGSAPQALAWGEFFDRSESIAAAQVLGRMASVAGAHISDILFTSGTTGHPKGVMTTHEQNLRAFTAWSDVVGLTHADRYLIVNPFFHAFGYKAGWLACLISGATIIPHAVFDPAAVLARIASDRISVLPGPPTLYQSLLVHPGLGQTDLSSLRLAVTGAASIPVELVRRMKTELGFETVITGYGLTEACGIATMCRFDDDVETIANTSGRAIPDVEVQVVDAEGRGVAPGQPGEVVIRGYNVMRGYFEAPEQTREVIDHQGFLHTGDVGVMDERGYLRITDRKKDMFIVGGFNCYPAEIENIISQHPAVAQVAVIGIPDERLGEVGMAYVVFRPHLQTATEELADWCKQRMANYKLPRRFACVEGLPLNAAGKVMKHVLRQQASDSGASKP